MKLFAQTVGVIVLISVVGKGHCATKNPISAAELITDIYNICLSDYSTSNCVKAKALKWIRNSVQNDEIKISADLSIVRNGKDNEVPADEFSEQKKYGETEPELLNKVNNFLATHSLKMTPPEMFTNEEGRSLIPEFLMTDGLAKGFQVPLIDSSAVQGRGFVKKVMIPFLLGLKFKTTVLVPISLALIALKTWKAMTFGLLSLVLSGALMIFKIAKPKVVNYEVVHYPVHHVDHQHIEHIVPHHIDHIVPHHVDHIVPHHVDHIVPHHVDHIPPHIEHISHAHHIDHDPHHHVDHVGPTWEPHGWARSSDIPKEPQDAQDMAYAGQI